MNFSTRIRHDLTRSRIPVHSHRSFFSLSMCQRSIRYAIERDTGGRERRREREGGRERERERLGDTNVSWDIGSTRCSPRFANSLADHDRRHVSVELSKYLARIPLGILIRVIVRQSSIPLFLATPWNLNVSNQKKWPCNQRRAGIIQQGMKAGRDRRNRNKTRVGLGPTPGASSAEHLPSFLSFSPHRFLVNNFQKENRKSTLTFE